MSGMPKLPAWSRGMCLAEYLPIATAAICDLVDAAVADSERRRSFLGAMAVVFGDAVELDEVTSRWRGHRPLWIATQIRGRTDTPSAPVHY
jgi:hypothetical protein